MRLSSDLASVFQLAVEKLLSTPETNNSSNPAGRQHKRTHPHLCIYCNGTVTTFLISFIISHQMWLQRSAGVKLRRGCWLNRCSFITKTSAGSRKLYESCVLKFPPGFAGVFTCFCVLRFRPSPSLSVWSFIICGRRRWTPPQEDWPSTVRLVLTFQFNSQKWISGWTQSSVLRWSSCIVSCFCVSGQSLSTQMKLKARSEKTTETRIHKAPHTNTQQHQVHTETYAHYTLPVRAIGFMICDLTFQRVSLWVRSDLSDSIFHLLYLDGFDQFSVSSALVCAIHFSLFFIPTN